MKNKIIQFVGVVSMLAATGATASTVFVDPASLTVSPNDVFTVTVRADFTDVGGVTAGGFLLTWDNNLLSLTSTSDLIPGNVFAGGEQITASSVDYGFATFSTLFGETTILDVYSLTFQVAADAATTSTQALLSIGAVGDVWTGADLITDVTPPPANFLDATINISAVPVPPAVWLFASGLLGLVGVARRRSQAVGSLAPAV
jgi:hypothetical protein